MKGTQKLNREEKIKIVQAVSKYLLFGLFLIGVLCFFFYSLTQRMIQSEKNSEMGTIKNRVREMYVSLDSQIERANAVSYALRQNENFIRLLNLGQERESEASYLTEAYQIGKQIRANIVTNDFIDDILIHFTAGGGMDISSGGMIMSDDEVLQFFGAESVEREEIELSDEEFTGGSLRYMPDGQMCYIQTYPVTYREEEKKSVIYIKIKDNLWSRSQKEDNAKDPAAVFYSVWDVKTEAPVLRSERTDLPEIDLTGEERNSGVIEKNGFLIAFQKSSKIPVFYVSIRSSQELDRTVSEQRVMSGCVLLLCIGVCLAFMLFNIWRVYNPIHQLLDQIDGEKKMKVHIGNYSSEMRNILLQALEQKMAYESLDEERHILEQKRKFITVLRDKKSDEKTLLESAGSVGIDPKKGVSCFVSLKFIDITACFSNEKNQRNEELPIHFCEAFLSKILQQYSQVVSVPQEDKILFCLMFSENRETGGQLKNNLKQTQKLLRETYAIDTLIAVSGYHSGTSGLRSGFREVENTMEYLEFTENKSFAEYSTFSLADYKKDVSMVRKETHLLNDIKGGEYQKAAETFREIMEAYAKTEMAPVILRFRLCVLMGKILESAGYEAVLDGKYEEKELEVCSDLMEFESVKEFQNKVLRFFQIMEKRSLQEEKTLNADFVREVKQMIAEHYMNPDLNVTAIADSFNKNIDFVSRTFKKATNEGLLDYIQKVRIEKAKQFFEENELISVQQVANMVGYVSCESFIRVFKSKEEITPGKYKNTIKNRKTGV